MIKIIPIEEDSSPFRLCESCLSNDDVKIIVIESVSYRNSFRVCKQCRTELIGLLGNE